MALALATVAAGCGGAAHGNALRDEGSGASAGTHAAEGATAGARLRPHDEPADPADDRLGNGLVLPPYRFGDCIAFPPEGDERQGRIVDCGKPHDIQMTVRIDGPDQDEFPAQDDWVALVVASCAAPAEALVGRPIDPYGRLTTVGIHPIEDGWADGSHAVDCGVGAAKSEPADRLPQLTEDVRGLRDQSDHYAAGECVTSNFPDLTIKIRHVVPCDQPHRREITGTVDYGDADGPPPLDAPDERCLDVTVAYLGGPIPEGWAYTSDKLHAESWAAGRRYTHCSLAQFDPATGKPIEVSGSARG
jgi:hypothetical protein